MGLRRSTGDGARRGRGAVLRHPGVIRLGALALIVVGCFVLVSSTGDLSAERVRGWVDGYGAAGPLVFIVVSACLTVALFPGPLLAGASGLLFGTALGTPVSIVAATLGATLVFSLARWAGRDAAGELARGRLQRAREWIGERGFLSVLYARIAPGVPYNLVNYAAGLAPIRATAFIAATAIGCAPRAFAYTALGGSLSNLRSPEAIIAFAVLIAMAIVAVVVRPSGPGTGSSSPAARSAAPR